MVGAGQRIRRRRGENGSRSAQAGTDPGDRCGRVRGRPQSRSAPVLSRRPARDAFCAFRAPGHPLPLRRAEPCSHLRPSLPSAGERRYDNITAARSEGRTGKTCSWRSRAPRRREHPQDYPELRTSKRRIISPGFGSASSSRIAGIKKTAETTTTTSCRNVSRVTTSSIGLRTSSVARSGASLTATARHPDRARRRDRVVPLLRRYPRRNDLKKLKGPCENPGLIYGQLVSRDARACLFSAGFIYASARQHTAYTDLFNYLDLKVGKKPRPAEIYISCARGDGSLSRASSIWSTPAATIVLCSPSARYFRRRHGVASDGRGAIDGGLGMGMFG